MAKIHKLAAYLLIGTLSFSGRGMRATAAQETVTDVNQQTAGVQTTGSSDMTITEEPVAGIDLTLDECYQNIGNADKKIARYLTTDHLSVNSKLAFAQVTDYVNIRNKPGENSEIIGKLYDNGAAEIIAKKNGWYHVKSGSINGYIKSDFLITGDKAASIANKVGKKIATVNTTTLKVRKEAAQNAEVLTLIPVGDEFKVVKDQKDWVKIKLGDKEYGYVSADYVDINLEYEEAVSIEEEDDNDVAPDSSMNSSVTSNTGSDNSAGNQPSQSSSSGGSSSHSSSDTGSTAADNSNQNSSSLGGRIVAYALQFEGNPYVWGGTSLTNGTDCSGFTQSVFAHFGISIPRTSRTQAACGSWVSLSNLEPGDLIFYARNGSINHVALYIGNGKVISASSPSTGIRITSYNYRQPVKAVSYIR